MAQTGPRDDSDPEILVFWSLEEKKMEWESEENIWRRPHCEIVTSFLNKSISYLIWVEEEVEI